LHQIIVHRRAGPPARGLAALPRRAREHPVLRARAPYPPLAGPVARGVVL